jgi:cell division protein FtsI/penicillin-binding protein 2
MVLKENAGCRTSWSNPIAGVSELRVELQPRFYPLGTILLVLGYVGEISLISLKTNIGFSPRRYYGKGGLEQYYDEYTRQAGYRKVLVTARPRAK